MPLMAGVSAGGGTTIGLGVGIFDKLQTHCGLLPLGDKIGQEVLSHALGTDHPMWVPHLHKAQLQHDSFDSPWMLFCCAYS